MAATLDDLLLWFEMHSLQERYVSLLDNDRLEAWPELFVEDGFYEIVPKENEDMGLPIGLVRCDNRRMMRDRVTSLRHANIYEAHTYRHLTSGLALQPLDADTVDLQSNYVVVQTRANGETSVFQSGRYQDRVVRTANGWRYRSKRVIYDTSRVQTLLATPI